MSKDIEDELFYKQPIFYSCTICGNQEDLNAYNPECELIKPMQKKHICYQCAYWLDIIENPPINMEVIGGIVYIANPFVHRPLQVIKGKFGKEFYIRKFDETILRVNNLWCLGEVPKQFKDKLPNTGNFVSLMVYQKLCSDNHKCYAKGCWDRYDCLRYNFKENGKPFNVIPKSHKAGDEKCPSFINIDELKI